MFITSNDFIMTPVLGSKAWSDSADTPELQADVNNAVEKQWLVFVSQQHGLTPLQALIGIPCRARRLQYANTSTVEHPESITETGGLDR